MGKLAYELLMALPTTEGSQTYTDRDTIFYNLGIGFGAAAIEDALVVAPLKAQSPITLLFGSSRRILM